MSYRTTIAAPTDTRHVGCGRFVLSRPHGTVTAERSTRTFDDLDVAVAALHARAVPAVVGAIPFSRDHPSALSVPVDLVRESGRWKSVEPRSAPAQFAVDDSDDIEHLQRVRIAIERLRDPSTPLEKVVLARRLTLTSATALAPESLLGALVDGTSTGNGFMVDLGPAGAAFTDTSLVGSSPEVLVSRRGRTVSCHPLAGSAPRHHDPDQDRTNAAALAESAKDLREHAFVVDAIEKTLAPLCSSLSIPKRPTLTHTPQLWHLGTPIEGTLRDPSTTALELAAALHPTPAVCGTPTQSAYEAIAELEGERGFYGGAVGWCDVEGDGEWMVAIRCARISDDGRKVTAYAGGGIVAESDPEAELRETTVKFGTVLHALGVLP